MARGNNKGDSKLRVSTNEGTYRIPKKADFNAAGKQALNASLSDPAVYRSVSKFLSSIEGYQGDDHFEKGSHKLRRQKIVQAFLALPQEIRSVMEVPKEFINKLYRGASHAANPGPDGTINASFSSDRQHAEEFGPQGWVGRRNAHDSYGFKEYKPDPSRPDGKYAAKDIQSFDGIINFSAINKFCAGITRAVRSKMEEYAIAHGDRLGANLDTANYPKDRDGMNIYWDDKNPKGFRLFELAKEHTEAGQNEYLVYGIKWKPGVK